MKTVDKRIYWSCRGPQTIDPSDPSQRRWWVKQVLINGTMADVRELDLDDIASCVARDHLPQPIQSLWRNYLDRRNARSSAPQDP